MTVPTTADNIICLISGPRGDKGDAGNTGQKGTLTIALSGLSVE